MATFASSHAAPLGYEILKVVKREADIEKQEEEEEEGDDDYGIDWRCRAFLALFGCFLLAVPFWVATEQVYQWKAPIFVEAIMGLFGFVGFLLYISFYIDQERPWAPPLVGTLAMIFAYLMLAQYQWQMALIAAQYPHSCELSAVETGVMAKYRGVGVQERFREFFPKSLQDSLSLQGKEPITTDADFDWDVECNDMVVLGTSGGREIISLLAHCVPLLFLLAYTTGAGKLMRTNLGGLMIDFVDLQDFFLLLLEDDLLLAFWNKADWWGRNGAQQQAGRIEWCLVFASFIIASNYLCLFPVVKILTSAVRRNTESAYINRNAESADINFEFLGLRFGGIKLDQNFAFFTEACCSICIVNLPFGLCRYMCSKRFHIIASTMLIKNVLAILYNLIKILSCGEPRTFVQRFPSLKMVFLLTEFYGSTSLQDLEKEQEWMHYGPSNSDLSNESISSDGEEEKEEEGPSVLMGVMKSLCCLATFFVAFGILMSLVMIMYQSTS